MGSNDMMTTRQYFELMSKHTGVACPRWSLNLTLGFWLGWLLTIIASWVTRCEPLMPVDIMRTALWGGIEYTTKKSEDVLGVCYTPIDLAVSESISDVKSSVILPAIPQYYLH